MMKKRILTLLVELDPLNKPEWIWQSHMTATNFCGLKVLFIGEGDQFKEEGDTNEMDA